VINGNNESNFGVWGNELSNFMHSIDVSNLVNGKPIYYLVNQKDLVINSATHPQVGYLALINCTNVTVEGLTLTNNGEGLLLAHTSNSRITDNSITNNDWGIGLSSSLNNSIYHNNFVNNTLQVCTEGSTDVWDDGYPSGGNYWSDYTGVDVKRGPSQDQSGSDGIGDTPYVIDADDVDRYPLMNPYGSPPPQTYSLEIATEVGGTTDPTPGTYGYTVNSTVQVTAIPDAYHLFDHWELDGVKVGSANPYSVLIDENHTLHAVFVVVIHDVAVTNVTPSKTVVGQGYSTSIKVTLENQGNFTENFNVTTYYDDTPIETKTVANLPPSEETTITFTLDTTGFEKGNYTISAYAWPVPGETDTGDNNYTDGTIRVNMAGDVAPEYGLVDIVDVVYVAIHFGAKNGEPEYEPNADINGDAIIDIVDIVIVAIHFGETDP
jgi:parallel beta-helix repeat protein